MALTAAERMARTRERRRAAGEVEVLVWVPKDRVQAIRDMAAKWCDRAWFGPGRRPTSVRASSPLPLSGGGDGPKPLAEEPRKAPSFERSPQGNPLPTKDAENRDGVDRPVSDVAAPATKAALSILPETLDARSMVLAAYDNAIKNGVDPLQAKRSLEKKVSGIFKQRGERVPWQDIKDAIKDIG